MHYHMWRKGANYAVQCLGRLCTKWPRITTPEWQQTLAWAIPLSWLTALREVSLCDVTKNLVDFLIWEVGVQSVEDELLAFTKPFFVFGRAKGREQSGQCTRSHLSTVWISLHGRAGGWSLYAKSKARAPVAISMVLPLKFYLVLA